MSEACAVHSRFRLLALMLALALSSCSFPQLFELANRSGSSIRIEVAPGEYVHVDHNWTQRFGLEVPHNLGGVTILASDCRMTFPVADVIDRYPRGMSKNVVPMQLEANHSLYLFPYGTRLPAGEVELDAARQIGSVVLAPECGLANG